MNPDPVEAPPPLETTSGSDAFSRRAEEVRRCLNQGGGRHYSYINTPTRVYVYVHKCYTTYDKKREKRSILYHSLEFSLSRHAASLLPHALQKGLGGGCGNTICWWRSVSRLGGPLLVLIAPYIIHVVFLITYFFLDLLTCCVSLHISAIFTPSPLRSFRRVWICLTDCLGAFNWCVIIRF